MNLNDLDKSFYIEVNGVIYGRVFQNIAGTWTVVGVIHRTEGIVEVITAIAGYKQPERAAKAFLKREHPELLK